MSEEDPAQTKPSPQAASASAPADDVLGDHLSEADIEALLGAASFQDPIPGDSGKSFAADRARSGSPSGLAPSAVDMPNFDRVLQEAQISSIELLRDVNLEVKVELGRSRMLVEDVLKLAEGSVVELDKLAGDPVEIFVNERLVARGEVLVLNDNFCVRVNEIVPASREEVA